MKFIFHPEAEDEFFDAIEYYEAVDVGLGYDFSLRKSEAKGAGISNF